MANYGARQPNSTAYIKHFITGCLPEDYWSISNNMLVTHPSSSVHILKDLIVDGTVTGSIFIPSDYKLKQNIVDLNLLDCEKIMKIKPKQFSIDNKMHYGFIAQEVQEYFPLLVHNGDALALNYIEMIPLLLHKIQDLQRQIDELK